MSFLDKLKEQAGAVADVAGTVAQNAVKQTKTLAAIGRVKLAIASEEDKAKKAYTELGRLFYRDYETQTEAEMEDYQPWCDKVSDAKNQITRLSKELEKLREGQGTEVEDVSVPMIEMNLAASAEDELGTDDTDDALPAPETADMPTVGTLYVDVTETEE